MFENVERFSFFYGTINNLRYAQNFLLCVSNSVNAYLFQNSLARIYRTSLTYFCSFLPAHLFQYVMCIYLNSCLFDR